MARWRRLGALGLVPAMACACSSTVETGDDPTGTGGSGGEGGGVTSSSSGGGFSTSTTTGGGGGMGGAGGASLCGAGAIELDVDGDGQGPLQILPSSCDGAWGADETDYATGFVGFGGKAPPDHLHVEGCSTAAPGSFPSLVLIAPILDVGSVFTGSAYYVDGTGVEYTTSQDVSVDVSQWEPTGGFISGKVTMSVVGADGQAKSLTGTFSVCHVTDQPPPP